MDDSNPIPGLESEFSQFFYLHWSDAGGLNFKTDKTLGCIQEKLKPIEDTQLWILEGDVKAYRLIDWYLELLKSFKEKTIPNRLLEIREVSFLSPNGPFKKIKLINTLNPETFELFVYQDLLSYET